MFLARKMLKILKKYCTRQHWLSAFYGLVQKYLPLKCRFAFSSSGPSCSGPAAQVTTGADWVTLGDAGIPGYYGVCWGTLGYTKVHWGTLRFSTTEVTPATAAYQVSLTTAPCMGCMAYLLNTIYHQYTISYHLYGFPLAPQHHHPVNWAWPKN